MCRLSFLLLSLAFLMTPSPATAQCGDCTDHLINQTTHHQNLETTGEGSHECEAKVGGHAATCGSTFHVGSCDGFHNGCGFASLIDELMSDPNALLTPEEWQGLSAKVSLVDGKWLTVENCRGEIFARLLVEELRSSGLHRLIALTE
jgi:hypothetical protein